MTDETQTTPATPAPPPPPAPPAEAPSPEPVQPLEQAAAQPSVSGVQTPTTAPEPPAAEQPPAPKEWEPNVLPPEWPYKGFRGPQPWEAVNPPAITQSRRVISSGTCGREVVELAALLERLGYKTPIAEGANPHAIYDSATAAAVRGFCQDYGVNEDPAIVGAYTPDCVGPFIWEALFRAARKEAG